MKNVILRILHKGFDEGGVVMKICVITMQGVYNYGSALQTFATQSYFESKGYMVEFIDYYPNRMRNYGAFVQLYRDAKPFHKSIGKSAVAAFIKYWSFKKLKKVFMSFSGELIKKTRKYESNLDLIKNPPNADVYCTGSDQVWNDYLEGTFDETYFLNFAPKEKKRISFSASFGRDDIKPDELAPVQQLLKQYSAISVREESGLQTLSKTAVPIKQCILDPTFMLTREEWELFATDILYKGYILVYKLHEDSFASEAAIAIAKKMNKKVIRISNDYLKRIRGGITVVAPEVRQFISYIANAELVVTDSFHATAFSINMNVPFISIRWKMFNNRIETILKKVNLEDRMVSDIAEAEKICGKIIDFTEVNALLSIERKKVDSFIEDALNQ